LVIGRIRNVVWGNGAQQASNDARVEQYASGMPMVWSHPWGHGIGTGGETLGFFAPSGLLTIDTYYLAVALEYGVLGFIIYYGMFAIGVAYAAVYAILARNRSGDYLLFLPISLALVNFLVIKSVFSEQDNHPLVFTMLGMLVALACRFHAEQEKDARTAT
jgi:O-antigen ligase